jgi:hypothetical protein
MATKKKNKKNATSYWRMGSYSAKTRNHNEKPQNLKISTVDGTRERAEKLVGEIRVQ